MVSTLRSRQSAESSLPPLTAVESARIGRPQLDATFFHSKSTLDLTLTLPETLEAPSTLQQIEAGHDAGDGDLTAYPSNLSVSIIVLGLCLASFTVALDNTIIATAIPRITETFNSLDDVGWYGSVYLLSTTAIQPSFGRIYTLFNVKITYLVALAVFELGSILCAVAVNSPMFMISRAVAGIGGAGMFSGAINIVGLIAPMEKRSFYDSIVTSIFGIASVVGPLLGGVLTDRLNWRWCFWINLPFGAIAMIGIIFLSKIGPRLQVVRGFGAKIKELDILGALFFISAIVCILLALQWGGTLYPWHNPRVWGCILGFTLLILIFSVLQVPSGDRATIPPRIMKQRTVLSSSLFVCFLAMGIYAHFYYIPFYFQFVKGTTATASGINTIPYIVSVTLFAVVGGALMTITGHYAPFMWTGAAIFTAGAGLLHTFRPGTGARAWVGYQIFAGVGAGVGLQVPFIAVQNVLPAQDMPTGNAITGFFNFLGAGVGVSIAQNIFVNTLAGKEAKGWRKEEAYNAAITDAFLLAVAAGGIAVLGSVFVERRRLEEKKSRMAAAG